MTKRCKFLSEVKDGLKLDNVEIVNARCEDYAKDHREIYSFCVSRAVAKLNILLEMMMPLIKVGGYFIALKGDKGQEELNEAKNALKILNGEVSFIQEEHLPKNNDKRINVFIEKKQVTKTSYPRLFAKIKKNPL